MKNIELFQVKEMKLNLLFIFLFYHNNDKALSP